MVTSYHENGTFCRGTFSTGIRLVGAYTASLIFSEIQGHLLLAGTL